MAGIRIAVITTIAGRAMIAARGTIAGQVMTVDPDMIAVQTAGRGMIVIRSGMIAAIIAGRGPIGGAMTGTTARRACAIIMPIVTTRAAIIVLSA